MNALALLLSVATASAPPLSGPISPARTPRIWMVPNQLAANAWYKLVPVTGGPSAVINGHLEAALTDNSGSFFRWNQPRAENGYAPALQAMNQTTGLNGLGGGGVGLGAAEIRFLSNQFINDLRAANLPIAVELPGMTQCMDGEAIAYTELFGQSGRVKTNLVRESFQTPAPAPGTPDPHEVGWFVTKDNSGFQPDEIIFDERLPNLLPEFDRCLLAGYPQKMDSTGNCTGTQQSPLPSWYQRKKNARAANSGMFCPSWTGIVPTGTRQVDRLSSDYLTYSRVIRQKWPTPPRISLHWNVNPGWEWRDEACLDQRHAGSTDETLDPDNLKFLRHPCYNNVDYLKRLIADMCEDGLCPSTVYVDVDAIYDTPYALEGMRRLKTALAAVPLHNGGQLAVPFGVNLVDMCAGRAQCTVEWKSAEGRFKTETVPESTLTAANLNHRASVHNMLVGLKQAQIIDPSTPVRVQSWTVKPREEGAQVDDSVPGSFPHLVKEISTMLP